jgi:hypothetical protein
LYDKACWNKHDPGSSSRVREAPAAIQKTQKITKDTSKS